MKTIVAIESCMAHQDRVDAILRTWGEGDERVQVFTGPGLGVPDDYDHLPEKTKAICQWAVLNDVDYLFKSDTDTYINLERLFEADYYKHSYSGYILDWLGIPYCSGPGYWLSRKSLEILARFNWDGCRNGSYPNAEDVTVGNVLFAHDIRPFHDERYALYRDVLPDNDVISSHLSSRTAYRIEMMQEAHNKAYGR